MEHDYSKHDYLKLEEGLPKAELDLRLRQANEVTNLGRRMLSFYLHDMDERRVYLVLGYPTTAHYADQRLEVPPQRTSEYIAVGAALAKLTRLDQAFLEGLVSWSKVLELVRVAAPHSEERWIDYAKVHVCREVKDAVARELDGRAPRQREKGQPGKGGLSLRKIVVRHEMEAVVYEKFERAMHKMRDERGGVALSQGEFIERLADMYLSMQPDGTVPGWKATDPSLYQVVVHEHEQEASARVMTPDGEVELRTAAREAILEQKKVSKTMRNKVLARDDHRCGSCGFRFDLQAHHIVFSSEGGATAPQNLTALCTTCHTLVHEGLLVLQGDGDTGVQFFTKDGEPLRRQPAVRDPVLGILRRPPASGRVTRVRWEWYEDDEGGTWNRPVPDFVAETPGWSKCRSIAVDFDNIELDDDDSGVALADRKPW